MRLPLRHRPGACSFHTKHISLNQLKGKAVCRLHLIPDRPNRMKILSYIIPQPASSKKLTTEMDGSSGPRARYSTGDWRNSCIQVYLFQFSKGKEGHLGWSSQSLLECFLSSFESISPSSSFDQVLIIASPSINLVSASLLHCLFVRILPPPPIFQILPRHFSPFRRPFRVLFYVVACCTSPFLST